MARNDLISEVNSTSEISWEKKNSWCAGRQPDKSSFQPFLFKEEVVASPWGCLLRHSFSRLLPAEFHPVTTSQPTTVMEGNQISQTQVLFGSNTWTNFFWSRVQWKPACWTNSWQWGATQLCNRSQQPDLIFFLFLILKRALPILNIPGRKWQQWIHPWKRIGVYGVSSICDLNTTWERLGPTLPSPAWLELVLDIPSISLKQTEGLWPAKRKFPSSAARDKCFLAAVEQVSFQEWVSAIKKKKVLVGF